MGRVFCAVYITLALMFAIAVSEAYADNHLTETRYCEGPKRYSNGRIVRSMTVVKEFERQHPLPVQYKREDWQIDHVIPLASGGCDAVRNMQWLPKTIKTCADDDCKDRWERKGIYDR